VRAGGGAGKAEGKRQKTERQKMERTIRHERNSPFAKNTRIRRRVADAARFEPWEILGE
jgi:hypothetical protein